MAGALIQPRRTARRRGPGPRAEPQTAPSGVSRRVLLAPALLVAALVGIVGWLWQPDGRAAGAIATLETADFHALAVSPSDPNVVFFGHHNGIMRSADGGRTWRPLVSQRSFDAMGLAVSRSDPHTIYLAGHGVFQLSTDGGAMWQPVQHNLPGTDIHGLAMSPDEPRTLSAFVVGHGVFGSADGGQTWQGVGGPLLRDATALVSAGGDPETLYVATARSGLFRSVDGGRTWVGLAADAPFRQIVALAVDPSVRRTLYAGTDVGLAKSADGGATWHVLPFPGGNAVALAVSPSTPDRLYAIEVKDGKGLVHRSENGGQVWGRD